MEPAFAQANLRAYNSWMAHWCSENPDRLKFAAPVVLYDIDEAIREAQRAARAVLVAPGAAARAENEEARRGEFARASGERFHCPPPLLPERIGFDGAEAASLSAERHAQQLESLSASRERLGPVNLVAADELAEAEAEARATEMVSNATVITGYCTYPHIDMEETGRRAAETVIRVMKGEINPAKLWHSLPMLTHMLCQTPLGQPIKDIMN